MQRISTDGGNIKLYCEDDLFSFRKELKNEELKKVSLEQLLRKVVRGVEKNYNIDCSYKWTYAKFIIHSATGYDVLKKIQEECGADIYLKDGTLHVHPPGAVVGSTGGEKVEIKCATSDEASMRMRGELEIRRRSFDGYDGSITTWLIPECVPGDSAVLHDGDYPKKDGTYFVRSVTTTFSREGGKRKIELGFKFS